jgi:hypothetical protein
LTELLLSVLQVVSSRNYWRRRHTRAPSVRYSSSPFLFLFSAKLYALQG